MYEDVQTIVEAAKTIIDTRHRPVLPMATSVPVPVPAQDKRRARHTCWTLNNWTETELRAVSEYANVEARYMCWAQEVGEEGTPHLQGYTAWDNPRSLEKFKQSVSPRLHYEPHTRGTAQQNRNYCLGMVEKKGFKENPTFEEVGEIPEQGTRTDWTSALNHLDNGSDIPSVVATQPQLLPSIRALERYKQLSLRPLNRDVKVKVLIGDAGTGKSRWAYDNHPDLYSKPDGQWYDGYTGQKTILLDDYYGEIPYSQFLKVLDRYPLQLPVKGGFVYAQYDTVIITSNKHPETWYVQGFTDALKRRIEIIEFKHTHAPQEDEEDRRTPQARRCSPPVC